MFHVSLYICNLDEVKNVLGVTKTRHQVLLETWDPLPILTSGKG